MHASRQNDPDDLFAGRNIQASCSPSLGDTVTATSGVAPGDTVTTYTTICSCGPGRKSVTRIACAGLSATAGARSRRLALEARARKLGEYSGVQW